MMNTRAWIVCLLASLLSTPVFSYFLFPFTSSEQVSQQYDMQEEDLLPIAHGGERELYAKKSYHSEKGNKAVHDDDLYNY